jgi:hypothetical protein
MQRILLKGWQTAAFKSQMRGVSKIRLERLRQARFTNSRCAADQYDLSHPGCNLFPALAE